MKSNIFLVFALVALVGALFAVDYSRITGPTIDPSVNASRTVIYACNDPDGGLIYNTASTITYTDATDTNKPLADFCVSATVLGERYCSGTSPAYREYTCPYGCSNGACKAAPVYTCSDSDNGQYDKIFGTATAYTDGVATTSKSDVCASTSVLTEAYCYNNGVGTVSVYCANGYECKSGACVKSSVKTCVDSDGENVYKVGTSKAYVDGVLQVTVYDSCIAMNPNAVSETFCDTNKDAGAKTIDCPSGYVCSNAVCVKRNEFVSCSETGDNGDDSSKKGTMSYALWSNGVYQSATLAESCASTSSVNEYYCDASGNKEPHKYIATCPSGTTCTDGACVVLTRVPTKSCSDSDGGDYKNIYGKASYYENEVLKYYNVDNCVDTTTVNEALCNRDGTSTFKLETCDTGYTCSNGACVAVHAQCTDTDGGKVYGTAGRTYTDVNSASSDVCSDNSTLTEYFCIAAAAGDKVSSESHSCGTGYECQKGACITKQQVKTCSETDSGKDKLVAGTNTIYENGKYSTSQSDYCYDASTVAEFTCKGGQWDVTYESCGSGNVCTNGACVPASAPPTLAPLRVITVDSSPAGVSTPSVSGVNVYLRNPTTGKEMYSGYTTTNGVTFALPQNTIFYPTTATTGALGGTYGFYQELDGKGVPSFEIKYVNGAYQLCRVSDNTCTSTMLIILYKLTVDSTNSCIDYDGLDYFVVSKIVYSDATVKSKPLADTCYSSTKVMERTCTGSTPSYQLFDCPSGYSCSNGACVSNVVEDKSCTGNAILGHVYEPYSIKNSSGTFKNYCYYVPDLGITAVMQYYCENGKTKSIWTACQDGFYCANDQNGIGYCEYKDISCKDTDPANDVSVAGNVSVYRPIDTVGPWGIFPDTCNDGTRFYEQSLGEYVYTMSATGPYALQYSCNKGTNGQYTMFKPATVTRYACPSGMCKNGACVDVVQVESCTSDSTGVDLFHKTNVKYYNPQLATPTHYYTDSCKDNSTVLKATCDPAGVKYQYKEFKCPSGYSCSEGVCSQTVLPRNTWTCYKADGSDTSKSGTLVFYNNSKEYLQYADFCLDKNTLVEWLCPSTVTQADTAIKFGWDATNGVTAFEASQNVYKKVDCGAGLCSNGVCVTEVPPLPTDNVTYTFNIQLGKGWNMISTPYVNADNYAKLTTDCADGTLKMFFYVPSAKQYQASVVTSESALYGGQGYWVKYSGEGNCNLKIADENKYFLSGKVLEEGWNQIGSQYYSSTSWDSVKGDCNVLKGPYYYDTVGKSWETPRTIEPGRSYFVKVSGKCTLGSELPPLPE